MKVAVVAGVIPTPDSGGGAITMWTVTEYLVGAGHEIDKKWQRCRLH